MRWPHAASWRRPTAASSMGIDGWTRPLREFQDTIPFVRAKRSPEHLDTWRGAFEAHMSKTGRVDVARLVYAAHLGLVDDAYRAAEVVRLGPAGSVEDIMGPDGYR